MKKTLCLFLIHFLFFCACTKEEIPITQPMLEIDLLESIFSVHTDGIESKEVKINTNINTWTIKGKDHYSWCAARAVNDNERDCILFSVQKNESIDVRTAIFIISGEGVENQEITIHQFGTAPKIIVDTNRIEIGATAGSFDLNISSNIEYTYKFSEQIEWISCNEMNSKSMIDKVVRFQNKMNPEMNSRKVNFIIQAKDMQDIAIPIEQSGSQNTGTLEIVSAKLRNGGFASEGYGPDKSIDRDYSTTYISDYSTKQEPILIEFELAKGIEQIHYIKLIQNDSLNFTGGNIWYQTTTETTWKEFGAFEVENRLNAEIYIPLSNPTKIRVSLNRTEVKGKYAVSLNEFECLTMEEHIKRIIAYFEDDVFSKLKPSTTLDDIENNIGEPFYSIAKGLYEQTYSTEFRSRTYKSIKSPKVVAKELTAGSRSQCDNPTGTFFEKDKTHLAYIKGLGDKTVPLYIRDFREGGGSPFVITLSEGLNTFTAKNNGHGYLQYWTEDETPFPDIKIHFFQGKELGFFDTRAGHTDDDWKRILANAIKFQTDYNITGAILDVLGERVQMTNKVDAFNMYAPNAIKDMTLLWDKLLNLHYKKMGLEKNKAIPQNRMLGVRTWDGPPNWNGFSANYPNYEKTMLDKDAFIDDVWVYAHEFGHGNQVAQMKGGGWGEVTNNIHSLACQFELSEGVKRLKFERVVRKRVDYPDQGSVIGGMYNETIFENCVLKELYWGREHSMFSSLIPLWQLMVFFELIGEESEWYKPDFWADVHWEAINDKTTPLTAGGERYMNFMRRCIDAADMDLTDFFTEMGLLRVQDRIISDYSDLHVKITQDMIDALKAHAKSKKPAATPVIGYISYYSLDAFKYKKDVTGTLGSGISYGGKNLQIISHSIWKNVVAFETYAGDKLIDIAIPGTGCTTFDNSSTVVNFTTEATAIKAVGWDGIRTLVLEVDRKDQGIDTEAKPETDGGDW